MPRKNLNQVSWKGKVTGIIKEDTEAYVQILCRPEFVVLSGSHQGAFNLYDEVIVEGSILVRKIHQDLSEINEGGTGKIQNELNT